MVANPVAITLNTFDSFVEMHFPSAISGTIYFTDTVWDGETDVGIVRSYYPCVLNDNVTSGVPVRWVYAMNPVFDGTQLAAVFLNGGRNLWVYDPVGGTWSECGCPDDRIIATNSLPSLNSNNIFVYDSTPPD